MRQGLLGGVPDCPGQVEIVLGQVETISGRVKISLFPYITAWPLSELGQVAWKVWIVSTQVIAIELCRKASYLSYEHLEYEHPEAPPVDGACVAGLGEDLGSQELGRATERTGAVTIAHAFLTQPKVSNLHKTIRVQQQIVQLQVSARWKAA